MISSLSSKSLVFMALLFIVVTQVAYAQRPACPTETLTTYYSNCQSVFDGCAPCVQEADTKCKEDFENEGKDPEICSSCSSDAFAAFLNCNGDCITDYDCRGLNQICVNNRCTVAS